MKFLKSKKLIAATVALVVVILGEVGVDISPEATNQIVNLIMLYIGSQGVVDTALVVKNIKKS